MIHFNVKQVCQLAKDLGYSGFFADYDEVRNFFYKKDIYISIASIGVVSDIIYELVCKDPKLETVYALRYL